MLALDAISSCSAWRMSGRRTSRSDGRPAGSGAMAGAVASREPGMLLRTASGKAWPSSSTSAFSSCARRRCCCARVARAACTRPSAWWYSSSDATPLSKRTLDSLSDSSRVPRVRREISCSSSSASRVYQPLATAATRLIWVFLRASSVEKYWASACSFRLATRPKKSISHDDTARPTWKVLA